MFTNNLKPLVMGMVLSISTYLYSNQPMVGRIMFTTSTQSPEPLRKAIIELVHADDSPLYFWDSSSHEEGKKRKIYKKKSSFTKLVSYQVVTDRNGYFFIIGKAGPYSPGIVSLTSRYRYAMYEPFSKMVFSSSGWSDQLFHGPNALVHIAETMFKPSTNANGEKHVVNLGTMIFEINDDESTTVKIVFSNDGFTNKGATGEPIKVVNNNMLKKAVPRQFKRLPLIEAQVLHNEKKVYQLFSTRRSHLEKYLLSF